MDRRPDWYPDPWGGPGRRYWDGTAWTAQIALPVSPPPPPHPTLALGAAIATVVTLVASLLASRIVLDAVAPLGWPIATYVALVAVIGYGAPIACVVWVSRHHGSGSFRADTGLFTRRADAGWSLVTWVACLGAQIAAALVVAVLRIPITSNTEGLDDIGADRAYVVSLLVVAVVAAPIAEEIVFRGVVLRGLLSRFKPVTAVGVQAVVFGVAHVDPLRGLGNIGLVMVLSAVGAVLGAAAYRLRRIVPSIVAHAILNAVAMTLALSGAVSD